MARDTDGIIQIKFANSGDVGLGGLDLNELWPISYSTPGGPFPQRIQFNQLFRCLSGLAVEINQKGPFLEYNATIDYAVGSVVIGSDTDIYQCAIANGPSSSVVDPVGDLTGTWVTFASLFDSGFYDAYIKVSDVKGTGVDGGDTSTGSWLTRDLNTEDVDTAGIATLAANQITIPAGTWIVRARSPIFQASAHQARIWDDTGSVELVCGTSEYCNNSDVTQTSSVVAGQFTIGASSAIELQAQVATAKAGNGFGFGNGAWGNNIYGLVELWRRRI